MSDPSLEEVPGEKCVRCGEVGEDRRTLWMACLYDMWELKVPFEQVMIRGTRHKMTGTEEIRLTSGGPAHTVPVFSDTPTNDKPSNHMMFTLRVCKRCRSEWMEEIAAWFNRPPAQTIRCGSGIFIRENGATKEITHEEWDRRLKAAKRKPAK